jgi:hypothetical protein
MKRAAACSDAQLLAGESSPAQLITEWPPPPTAAPAKQAKLLSSSSGGGGDGGCGSSSASDSSSDDPLADDDAEADAAVALAKFWRHCVTHRSADMGLSGISSSSRIVKIARSTEGRKFLERRAAKLQRLATLPSPRRAALFHALASALDYLGDVPRALEVAAQAVALAPRKRRYKWLQLKLGRHAAAQTAARAAWPTACPTGCSFRTLQRVHCSQLSTRRFFEDFALQQRPVIITGLQVTRQAWTLDVIARCAAHARVDVKCVRRGSCEWAGLEVHSSTTVAEFIRNLESAGDDASGRTEQGYLFDWSLPQVRALWLCAFRAAALTRFTVLPRPRFGAHHPAVLRPRSAAEAARWLHVQSPSRMMFHLFCFTVLTRAAGLLAQSFHRPRRRQLRSAHRRFCVEFLDGCATGEDARCRSRLVLAWSCSQRRVCVCVSGDKALDNLGCCRAAVAKSRLPVWVRSRLSRFERWRLQRPRAQRRCVPLPLPTPRRRSAVRAARMCSPRHQREQQHRH